jgi:hypothetical protein
LAVADGAAAVAAPKVGMWNSVLPPVAASPTTISLNSFAVNGEDCRKAGRCEHAQSGLVVVDSQSIMQDYFR